MAAEVKVWFSALPHVTGLRSHVLLGGFQVDPLAQEKVHAAVGVAEYLYGLLRSAVDVLTELAGSTPVQTGVGTIQALPFQVYPAAQPH